MRYEAGEKPAFLQRMIAGDKARERPTIVEKTDRDTEAPELEDEAPLIVNLDEDKKPSQITLRSTVFQGLIPNA